MTHAEGGAERDQAPFSPEAVKAWRQARRRELLAARMALAPDEHTGRSAEVVSRVLTAFADHRLPALRGRTVGGYVPFRGEIDVWPLLHEVLRRGADVALPVVVGAARPLRFRRWRPGDPMEAGVYGIPYPARGDWVEPDLLLVALLGFDAAYYRLGYGGGFYDQTLQAATGRPFTVGIGLELGRLLTIHPRPHDVALDYIATETGLFGRPAST